MPERQATLLAVWFICSFLSILVAAKARKTAGVFNDKKTSTGAVRQGNTVIAVFNGRGQRV
jgi:hypothetical protein